MIIHYMYDKTKTILVKTSEKSFEILRSEITCLMDMYTGMLLCCNWNVFNMRLCFLERI